jgi:hypothetical protein
MGLRAALRQDPDVIMIGEMRDAETVDTAIKAAETGHLLMSTLHTPDAQSTILRVMAMFPPEEQNVIRIRLAESLSAIISQRLLPKISGKGRAVATEIMINTPAIKDLILEERPGEIATSSPRPHQYGMQTFDQCLRSGHERRSHLRDGEVGGEQPSDFELKMTMFSRVSQTVKAAAIPSEEQLSKLHLEELSSRECKPAEWTSCNNDREFEWSLRSRGDDVFAAGRRVGHCGVRVECRGAHGGRSSRGSGHGIDGRGGAAGCRRAWRSGRRGAKRWIPSGKALIAGTAPSRRERLQLTRDAAARGADAVLVVAPHYYGAAMTTAAVRSHYLQVADASPCRFCWYNIPKYMHFAIDAALVAELAQHQNIIGIEDSSGNREMFAGYMKSQSPSFAVLTGNGPMFHHAMATGAAVAFSRSRCSPRRSRSTCSTL